MRTRRPGPILWVQRGVGRPGATGSPPAVVNAAMDALRDFNISHLDMPLTPAKIWRALQGHEEQKAG